MAVERLDRRTHILAYNPDALYDRPHKEITNEGGTLIIIHDADSSEWHFFECLV